MFKDEDGKPYAVIVIGGKQEVCPINGKQFLSWLNAAYRAKMSALPSPSSLQAVQSALEAEIMLNGSTHPLRIRVAKHDGAFWYDLGECVIRIDEHGWMTLPSPPILFRKLSHHLPQVAPSKTGDINKVLKYLNLKDDKQRLLLLATLVSCFIPDIPHPVIAIHGSKGAGKTSMQRILRKIIDPSRAKPSTLSKNADNLTLQLSQNYLTTYDNLDHINGPQSDLLCQAVTGGSAEKRQLYTDEEMITTNFQGVVTINGINLVASRPDLLERCVILELQRIGETQRRTEDEIWQEFDKDLPDILAGIFDTIAKATKILPTLTFGKLPRMADFAKIGCAIAIALGHTAEDFLSAYSDNMQLANDQAINSNPLAESVRIFMAEKNSWSGTVGQLYQRLNDISYVESLEKGSRWPKGSNLLRDRLKEVEVDLREFGIEVKYLGRSNHGAMIQIVKESDDCADGDDVVSDCPAEDEV